MSHLTERKEMMTKQNEAFTHEQLAAIQDSDLNFSDLPELDNSFWKKAEMVEPDNAENRTTTVRKPPLP